MQFGTLMWLLLQPQCALCISLWRHPRFSYFVSIVLTSRRALSPKLLFISTCTNSLSQVWIKCHVPLKLSDTSWGVNVTISSAFTLSIFLLQKTLECKLLEVRVFAVLFIPLSPIPTTVHGQEQVLSTCCGWVKSSPCHKLICISDYNSPWNKHWEEKVYILYFDQLLITRAPHMVTWT